MDLNTIWVGDEKDLFDQLIFGSITPDEFRNNQGIIKDFSEVIDKVTKMENGYALMTIDIKKIRNIVIITPGDPTSSWRSGGYRIFSNTITTDMENPVQFKLHELKDDPKYNIAPYLEQLGKTPLYRSGYYEDFISLAVVQTLNGYSLNLTKINEIVEMCEEAQNTNTITGLPSIESSRAHKFYPTFKNIDDHIQSINDRVKRRLTKFVEGLKCKELDAGDINKGGGAFAAETPVRPTLTCYGEITEVITTNNKRVAKVMMYDFNKQGINNISCVEKIFISYKKPGSARGMSDDIKPFRDSYMANWRGYTAASWITDYLPYNFMDKGRRIAFLGKEARMSHVILSADPKVKPLDTFEDDIKQVITDGSKDGISVNDTMIRYFDDKKNNKVMRLSDYINSSYVDAQTYMKFLKMMVDEFKYMIKRQKSTGEDVKITDEIVYSHEDGTIRYKDFSISTTSEAAKQAIYRQCSDNSIEYFRKKITEQEIIDAVMEAFFYQLRVSVEGWGSDLDIGIKLNDAVDIHITRGGGNNFTYINGQRFNKNEVVPVIKEMTCYRDQETADKFIKMIGKLGLSVYIGITTGYQASDRIYRFKKEKRARYTLIIDDVEVHVKGKKILNYLYNYMNGNAGYGGIQKLDEMIFSACDNPYDYIKYKFLIDQSYKVFMERSKEFLNKKVEEAKGEFVKYNDPNRRKVLDGIKVKGSSGRSYVIAYDSQESFVFMAPVKQSGEENTYTKGTYICMIDQSSIKSNIGYDTVISKLLSLKNDSVIASKIYNLEEELNK